MCHLFGGLRNKFVLNTHALRIWVVHLLDYINIYMYKMYVYLTDFLKTNLTKCEVISVKKASKGRFRKPENLQNHSNEEKERRKRKSEEKERRRREKKTMVAPLVFITATLEIVVTKKKNCWTQKVHLAITLSKIRRDIYSHALINESAFFRKLLAVVERAVTACCGVPQYLEQMQTFSFHDRVSTLGRSSFHHNGSLVILFIAGFQFHAIINKKNQNGSIDIIQNLGNERR